MKQYPVVAILISIIVGLAVGIIDMTIGYAPLPHIVILVGAVILSALHIKKSWVIAVILGGSIPIVHVIVKALGLQPPYEFTNLSELLTPIGLAFGGSMIGVRISANWMKTPFEVSSEKEE